MADSREAERAARKAERDAQVAAMKEKLEAVIETKAQELVARQRPDLLEPQEAQKLSHFDYSGLPADIADEARATAKRVRERMNRAIVEVGQELRTIKEKLEHGQFTAWIRAEFGGMSERTAQRYMSAAEAFGGKSDTVSVLPARSVFKLAAKSTPHHVREEVVARIEAGEKILDSVVDEYIAAAKAKAKPMLVVQESSSAPEPSRILSAADLAVRPVQPSAEAKRQALEADPDPERFELRDKWLWLHRFIAERRRWLDDNPEEATPTERHNLAMLDDIKEDYSRLMRLKGSAH